MTAAGEAFTKPIEVQPEELEAVLREFSMREVRSIGSETLIAERRSQLVDAASREFSSRGYQQTSISDVVNRAGLDRRLVYNAIGTKTDLLYLIFLDYQPRLLAKIRSIRHHMRDAPHLDTLRSLLVWHAEEIRRNKHMVLFSYREMRHLSAEDAKLLLSIVAAIFAEYKELFAQLVETGAIPEANTTLLSQGTLVQLDMIGLHGWSLDQCSTEQIADHIYTLLTRGSSGAGSKA